MPRAGPGGAGPTPDPFGTAAGIITPDGTLIVARFGTVGAAPEAWTLAPADPRPWPVRLTGLPNHIGQTEASAFTGNADTGYLIKPTTGSTLYRSLDGRTWSPVRVHG